MLIISTDNTCHFIVVSMFLSCFGFAVTQFLFVGFTIHHSFSLSVNFMIQKGVKIFISWQVGKGELTPFASLSSLFSASISNRGGLHGAHAEWNLGVFMVQ
jgi:hypothetical protein